MSSRHVTDIPASVRARLLNQSRDRNEDFNLVLLRYALERLMYRLSVSDYSEEFIIFEFKGDTLCKAIQATFRQRKTSIPSGVPIAFTAKFYENSDKQSQWSAFVGRNELMSENLPVASVIKQINSFLLPPARALSSEEKFSALWPKGGPWKPTTE